MPRGAWCDDGEIEVGGYARGIACLGERLWVGLSAPRRISRSKVTPNQGIDAACGAELVRIDLKTCTVTDRRALDGLGEEIYDLLILKEGGPVGRKVDALVERITSLQATVDAIRVAQSETNRTLDSLAEALQSEQAYSIKLAEALQAEQAYSMKLAQELHGVRGSPLWRAAHLLRRLIGRPQVPELGKPLLPEAAPADPLPPVLAETSAACAPADDFRGLPACTTLDNRGSRSDCRCGLEQTAASREALSPPPARARGAGDA